jgi:predicted helicase
MASSTTRRSSRWAHQPRLIAAVVEGLHRHDRGQLISACGSGWTPLSLGILTLGTWLW